jgi:hypothetical protein
MNMEKLLPRSVKLYLHQPNIMCVGRDRVSCTYRGKVIEESEGHLTITFKYRQEIVTELYSKKEKSFLNLELQDLKIKE